MDDRLVQQKDGFICFICHATKTWPSPIVEVSNAQNLREVTWK